MEALKIKLYFLIDFLKHTISASIFITNNQGIGVTIFIFVKKIKYKKLICARL